MTTYLPQRHVALEWLHHFYQHTPDNPICLFSIEREGNRAGERNVDWLTVESRNLDPVGEIIVRRSLTCDVWYGVGTRKEVYGSRRGGDKDIAHLPALWLDIDVAGPNHKTENALPPTIEAAHALLDAYPLPPSSIVKSGGGLQAYWLLSEPILVDDDTRQLLRRWQATWAQLAGDRGWHIDNVSDPARVMRLPGTLNRKQADGQPVEWVTTGDSYEYGADDLDQYLIEPPEPARHADDPVRPLYNGPQRPGDAYNAQHTGNELLRAHGFTEARYVNGETHYTRPGKEVREGTSATVYSDDGHTTIWSDTCRAMWPTIPIRQPLDPFGLYVHLEHGGDFSTASSKLRAEGYGTQSGTTEEDVPPPDVERTNYPIPIDWPSFWKRDRTVKWIIEPVIPVARHVVLYAPAKEGKSLFAFDLAASAATGRPCLGQPATEPRTVVYFDFEMTEDDVDERLCDMGYSEDDDLSRLFYYSLPSMPPFDTPEGGAMMVEIAKTHDAELVIVDTMARVVQGEENSADTYRLFDLFCSKPLKAAGIAVLRLDHTGKDAAKGQRGSSEKVGYADVVWRLEVSDAGRATLTSTHRRVSWVPQTVNMQRREEPVLSHVRDALDVMWPAGTKECAELLDALNIPQDAPVRVCTRALREHGQGRRISVITAAQRFRRLGNGTSGEQPGNDDTETGSDQAGTASGNTGNNEICDSGKHCVSSRDTQLPNASTETKEHPDDCRCEKCLELF